MMKEELYKNNYEKYTTVKYKDRSSIMSSRTGLDDYLGMPTKKHPVFKYELSDSTEQCYSDNFGNSMWSVEKKYFIKRSHVK